MSIFANAVGLPRVDDVITRSRSRVEQRVFRAVVGMSEEAAKRELSRIASEEVNSVLDEMLGDKKNSFLVRKLKHRVVQRASRQLVDQMWDDVKAKIKEGVSQEQPEEASPQP